MKQLISFLVISGFLSTTSLALAKKEETKYPRQKISLSGATLPNTPKSLTVKDLESFKKPAAQVTLYDPYNKNIKTLFYGFYLKDFAKAYGDSQYKTLKIEAIDGYKVDVPRSTIENENLFLTYKDETGYLTVDRMGPARIFAPINGVINKDTLLKIGVYWVWQINKFEFVK
jgi:hypothetical protein